MVNPHEDARVSAELAAQGTDASPLEAVLEPVPEDESPTVERTGAMALADAEEPSTPEAAESADVAPAETLYEVLGVGPKASRDQIDKAHRFCLDMYKEGALATYSLLDPGDAEAARRKISFAHETLADVERRRQYDLSLGLVPATPAVVPFSVGRSGEAAAMTAPSVAVPDGPLGGADLRRVRESRGIALREIAASTKIGHRFLEYLEEDRFAMLPPAVYLRGFLQEYARALGMDPRRTAEAYMARMASRE
jgi:hypothetical protein